MTEIATVDWFRRWLTSVFAENTLLSILTANSWIKILLDCLK